VDAAPLFLPYLGDGERDDPPLEQVSWACPAGMTGRPSPSP